MKIDGIEIIEAFAEPLASNIIDVINPHTGRGAYSDETLEQVQIRYPSAQRYNLDQWIKDKETRENFSVEWVETTEEAYTWGLECLPPALWADGFLLVGEPSDHHGLGGAARFPAYKRTIGGFFAASRPMTRKETRELIATSL
jgi:hypothetical protein